MSSLLVLGFAVLVLPTILIVIMPLIDDVFSTSFVSSINDIFDILEVYIGSDGINIFIIIFSLLLFFIILRYILSYISSIK